MGYTNAQQVAMYFGRKRRRMASWAAASAKFPATTPIAFLGDSMGRRASFFTTAGARTTAENRQNGELNWSLFRKPRAIYRSFWDPTATAANLVPTYAYASADDPLFRGLNFSLSGDSAVGITRRVQQVINSGARVCIVAIGTNVGADGGSAGTIAAIQLAVETLRAAGILVILATIRPRRVTTAGIAPDITPAGMGRILTINDAIRANWRAWGASALWDSFEALRDKSYPVGHEFYGSINPAYAISDGVHLTPLGAYVSSLFLDPCLDELFGDLPWFADAPSIAPAFGAAGGTVGAGAFGSIPAGWAISNAQGAALPVTVQSTYAGAGAPIVLDLTSVGGGAANSFNTVRLSTAAGITAGFSATDWIVSLFEVEIVVPSLAFVMMQGTLGQTSTISARGMGQTTAAYNDEPSPISQFSMRGWVATEPLLVETRASLSPRLDLSGRIDLAGVGQVRVHGQKTVAVPNPETAHPWVP